MAQAEALLESTTIQSKISGQTEKSMQDIGRPLVDRSKEISKSQSPGRPARRQFLNSAQLSSRLTDIDGKT